PSRYSPLGDPAEALQRAEQVLANMVAAGFLDAADAKAARAEGMHLKSRHAGTSARYFADWLIERAAGFVGRTDRDIIVRTTLSPKLQQIAEQKLESALKESGGPLNVHQGALVSLSPDGAIRAMVGGRDYGDSQFNRATQALRQ